MSDFFEGNAPQDPSAADPLEALVGTGKKFADAKALAKAKLEADAFIEQLKRENEEMRTDLKSRLSLEEMMDKLQTSPKAGEMPNQNRQEPGPGSTNPQVNLAEEVAKLVQKERSKEKRDANIAAVRDGLKDRFGADYNQRLEAIAAELEVKPDFLRDMAASSPSGFFKLVDSVAKPDSKNSFAPPKSAVDTGKSFNQTTRKNKEYYRNLRKADPAAYFSPKIQNEMHREALAQGPQFYQ